MNYSEQALIIPLAGDDLLAIISRPDVQPERPANVPRDCAVLIVVGGPQYRVGSHRQFLLLARRLAAAGYPAMRFDYRGMGDGGGAPRDFTAVTDDLAAAIDALQGACPGLKRIVLWGLCDAASAALLYLQATRDARIAGLVLLNPWVRSEAGLAQTQIKHYYGQRLLERAFWVKLLRGQLQLRKSLGDLLENAIKARRKPSLAGVATSFQARMAQGWRQFGGPLLLILSGNDLTAKEFLGHAATDASWSGLIDAAAVTRIDLADADHTFSAPTQRSAVEDETLKWLATL